MAGALKRGESRIYAQRFIVQGVRQGLSGNQILQNLRSAKVDGTSLGYRTENFYTDYNRYAAAKRLPALTRLADLPPGFSVDYALKTPTRGGNRIMYPVQVSGTNTTTGESVDITVSFVSPIPIIDELLPNAVQMELLDKIPSVSFNTEDITFLEPKEFVSEVP